MTRWPAWAAGLTLVFAAAALWRFFGGVLPAGLFATALLALFALIAAGSGRVLVGRLGLSDVGESQKTLIGLTLGLGLLSLGAFALSALRLLTPVAASLLLGALWIVGYAELKAVGPSLVPAANLLKERPAAAAAIGTVLAALLWFAWMPPHQYDSLVYHLALPDAYIRAGGFTPGQSVYSHFPQNGEMLFALSLLFGSDLLAQSFMGLATVLTVWWVFELGRREAPLSAVLLACWLLVTHTAVMLLASTTYVEPLAMLWVTAAVLSFFRWRGMTSGQPGQRSWLLLSAVFTGLALGTKYYAGISAGLLGLTLAARCVLGPSSERRARATDLALFAGVTTALFLPWLVKNAALAGNPFFPFFYRWFPNTGSGWQTDSARTYFEMLTEYGHRRGWHALARLPIQLLGSSLRFGGGMDVLGDFGWDLLFWSLPLAGWAAAANRFLRGLLLFCAAYLAAWLATGVVLRFLSVLAPLLCLLAGAGLYALWGRLGRGGRSALGGAVALFSVSHAGLFLYVHGVFGSGRVLLGLESREGFLSRRLDYYPCAAWGRAHLDKNVRILIVGEQRGYYLERDHLATTVNAPNRFIGWAEEASDAPALAGRLKAEGFSHVLLVPREARRLRERIGALSERGLANWAGLEPEHLAPAFRGPACVLYGLK